MTGFLVVALVILAIGVTWYRAAFLSYQRAYRVVSDQRDRVWLVLRGVVEAETDNARRTLMAEFIEREQEETRRAGDIL